MAVGTSSSGDFGIPEPRRRQIRPASAADEFASPTMTLWLNALNYRAKLNLSMDGNEERYKSRIPGQE